MADSKYHKELDRQAVLFDKQNRIIDLTDFSPILPDVGIYDEPVRYFKANEQWTKLIFGWLAWMQDEAFWPESEGQDYAGIQAILIFEQGIEATGMATKEDIRDGMYEAMNRLALQIVTGQYAGVSLSTDAAGTVTPTPEAGSDATLPEDDPLTTIDETESARYGAAYEVAYKWELFLSKIDNYYGATNGTPVTTATDTKIGIKAYFPNDGAIMDTAIDNYYTYRGTSGRILFTVGVGFIQYLYCNGISEFGISRWIVDVSGYSAAKINTVLGLLTGLSEQFFSDYFAIGAAKPNNAYLDAACVPVPPQTLTGLVFATTRSTTALKASHRMKFKFTGYALDVDGDIQDSYWYRTAAGVITRSNPVFTYGANSLQPSDFQIPYNAAHIYEYTKDLSPVDNTMTITPTKNAGMNGTGLTYPTAFAMELVDEGLGISE